MKSKVMSVVFLGLITIGLSGVNAGEPVMSDYTVLPLFVNNGVSPNVLIILDNSGSMNNMAYNETFVGMPYNKIGRTMDIVISDSSDDAEESMSCGSELCVSYTQGLDLDLGMGSVDDPNQLIGLRFKNVVLGSEDQVLSAYVEFNTDSVFSGTQESLELEIAGEDIGSAMTFQSLPGDISKRSTTTAKTLWSIPSWDKSEDAHLSPDLSNIVSEIANRQDWESGNSMVFLFKNSSGNPTSGRIATAWDFDPAKAPILRVTIGVQSPKTYYGYFNPGFFYVYDSNKFNYKYKKVEYWGDPGTGGFWKVKKKDAAGNFTIDYDLPNSEIATGNSAGLWDGNWLNWLSMRRIDVLRKVLTGGLASGRSGLGSSTNIGENSSKSFVHNFDATGVCPVSPYQDSTDYDVVSGSIDTPDENYLVQVEKDAAYEPDAFTNYNNGEYLSGIIQKIGDKARWGSEKFLQGDGDNQSGGVINKVIGDDYVPMLSELENTVCDTYTPLAESYYVAMQYFKQEVPADGLGYKIEGVPMGGANDPYNVGGTAVPCAKSFVILLTDGASTLDLNIPELLKDYDNDGKDSAVLPIHGSDYLDDIALYARTNDLRSDLDGDQNLYLYTVYAFSNGDKARQLLKDAARNGGFEDLDGDRLPDGDYGDPALSRLEWDKDGNNIPDTFSEARDGANIELKLLRAFTDILNRAASGTAVSVLSTSGGGDGIMTQAYFKPLVSKDGEDTKWIGYLQSLWVDSKGNMREDSNKNLTLDVGFDRIVRYVVKAGSTKIDLYAVTDDEPYPDLEVNIPVETLDMDQISPLWDAGARLAVRDPATRKIFTFVDGNENGVVDELLYNNYDSLGEMVTFDMDSLFAVGYYLGILSDTAWSHLGDNPVSRVKNIISFIRGNDDNFWGEMDGVTIRSRSVGGKVWKLGDIIFSTPTFVSAPSENYDLVYKDTTYYDYYNAMKDRESVVYVGANDGMLHAFTSWKYNQTTKSYEKPILTTEMAGDELWAYIPQAVLPHLKWLPDENYSHVSYVDQKPKVFDAKILPDDTHYTDGDTEENWGTFLIQGLNMGGRHIWTSGDFDGLASTPDTVRHFYPSYTCIDITDPRNPVVMWERTYAVPASPSESSENDTDQGLATSYPAVMKVNDKWFAVIGSGPQDFEGTSQGKGHLFVVDLKTGEPEKNIATGKDWLFEVDDADGFMTNPITYDRDLNYSVDALYIGETHGTGGSIYKLAVPRECDLPDCSGDNNDGYGDYYDDPNSSTNPWAFSKMFDSITPVTAPASISVDGHGNAWIFFGTGRYLSDLDKINIDDQYLYGIKDPFYNPVRNSEDVTDRYYYDQTKSMTLYPSDLLNSNSYKILANGDIMVDSEILNYSSLKQSAYILDGWQKTMEEGAGERAISKPSIIGGLVLFTSYVPDNTVCSAGGESNLYSLYYETGTSPLKPAFNNGTYTDLDANVFVKDVIPLGKGLTTSASIHIGLQDKGKVSSFFQKSTGEVLEIKIDPFLKVRSGLKYWKEK